MDGERRSATYIPYGFFSISYILSYLSFSHYTYKPSHWLFLIPMRDAVSIHNTNDSLVFLILTYLFICFFYNFFPWLLTPKFWSG